MRLLTNVILLGLGLVGMALSKSICCTPGCGACLPQDCLWGYCPSGRFNTCCADEKRGLVFKDEKEYLEAAVGRQLD